MTQPPYPGQPPQPGPIYPQTNNPYPQAGPSNPGYPPQPHNQPYPPQPPPPTPTSKTKTGIIITMSVIIVALAAVGVYFAFFRSSSTQTAKRTRPPYQGWTISGNQLTGPSMTAQLPEGWQLSDINGRDNDGDLVDPSTHNLMNYWADYPSEGNAEKLCKEKVQLNHTNKDDPVEQITGQTWGGKPAVIYRMAVTSAAGKSFHHYFCRDNGNGGVALLHTAGVEKHEAKLDKDTQTIVTTWQWK